MVPRRRLRLDLFASGLLLVGLAVALCVLSHETPAASSAGAFPPTEPGNLFGPAGAWLAQELFQTLGLAVYPFLASWFVLVFAVLMRRRLLTWTLRLTGCLLLLPCAALLADHFGHENLGGPLTGSGGSLGAWLNTRLQDECGQIGTAALVTAALALGLMLAANYLLLRGLYWLFRWARFATRLMRRWFKRRAKVNKPKPTFNVRIKRGEQPAKEEPLPAKSADDGIPIRHHDDPVATGILDRGKSVNIRKDATAPLVAAPDPYDDFELPTLALLEDPQPFPYDAHDQKLREKAALLEKTFADFNLNVRVVGINTGPVITQYEVALETGLRVNKVTVLGDDLALNLRVPSVRIVAPIPGKNTVGIEIPNEHRAVVRLKELLLSSVKKLPKLKVPLLLGKDTEGRALLYDLAEMPHLLIAGRTGTGKSVCLNAIILSILMTRRPDEVKMILIDPKMTELIEYAKLPHLMHPVVTDMKKAEAILSWAVDKMEERYELLSRARIRSLAAYNELSLAEIHRRVQPNDDEERKNVPEKMPYIVIVVDELTDLMMMHRREVEGHIIRLAQKSRAAGIHLVLATQKPTVDVITGLIKSNLPARICFQVSSRSDSRVVLDEMGADKLLGKGDMLFLQPGTSTLLRGQGTFLSDKEITSIVQHLECDQPCFAPELMNLPIGGSDEGDGSLQDRLRARDDVYEQAIEVVVREGRGSVSLLQRTLGIGYGRAARLIDFMAEDGIVGTYNGSNAREVLYTPEQWQQTKGAE